MVKDRDIAFEMAASSVRYGAGVTREIGADLADRGHRRVMVVTDRVVAALPPVAAVLDSLETNKISIVLYDYVRVEPTDTSMRDAIEVAEREACDAFVAVGGGSAIDTAKAANLYSTHPPRDFLDYVNPPIGKGLAVPGPLKPLFAIPTTAGTGSETTGIAVFDLEAMHVKTGISSRLLKPTPANDWTSAAIVSNGQYGVPKGLVFGYPCRSDGNGNLTVVDGLVLDPFGKSKFETTLKELLEEQDAVKELLPG